MFLRRLFKRLFRRPKPPEQPFNYTDALSRWVAEAYLARVFGPDGRGLPDPELFPVIS